ncbi:MAG: pilin [Candidatus Shapirobacteria bacterium]|nr:pilin [Candidatus Shapirobacteria bacterium]
MKKKIIISIFASLIFLFSLKQITYACSFSAPSSTNPNTKIKIVTSDIPSCGDGYCSAFVVYDSSGKEFSCNFVDSGLNTREITNYPSSGDSITISIEKRAADTTSYTALNNQSCSNEENLGEYCSYPISLGGVPATDKSKPSSCSASFMEGQVNYLTINFQNAKGYAYYVIDPTGNKQYTGSVSSNSYPIQIGENWPSGGYTVQIVDASTSTVKIIASCTSSNSYSGVSALNKLNEEMLNIPHKTFFDLTTKVNTIIWFSVRIAGGIAFLLIIIGAFQIILSAGNPDRVKAGKEMITAALAGLFLIIFSIFILKLIGVDILQIKDFTG